MGSRYKLRARKRSVESLDESTLLDEQEMDLLPPTRKKSNAGRRSASRGENVANGKSGSQDAPVVNQPEVLTSHDPEQGLDDSSDSAGHISKTGIEEPIPCSSKGGNSIELVIDTPPNSVQDDHSSNMDRMEEDIPFSKEDTSYYEQNKTLYKLYRERLDRVGTPDPYVGYKNGFKASYEPWSRRSR